MTIMVITEQLIVIIVQLLMENIVYILQLMEKIVYILQLMEIIDKFWKL